ncbi:MAG: hypothetical protein Q9174_006354, partial [Haloplaca sp. 1 TL-2023]
MHIDLLFATSGPPLYTPTISAIPFFLGNASESEKAFAPLLGLGPMANNAAVYPYPEWSDFAIPFCEKGQRKPAYGASLSTEGLVPETWRAVYDEFKAFVKAYPQAGNSSILAEYYPLQKAIAIGDNTSSYPFREVPLHVVIIPLYADSSLDDPANAFGARVRDLMWSTDGLAQNGSYINFAHGDETLEQVYGATIIIKGQGALDLGSRLVAAKSLRKVLAETPANLYIERTFHLASTATRHTLPPAAMAATRKYAALVDLDDAAPDIYETPELTDDTSTVPASSTFRSDSGASSPLEPEGNDPPIDRHRIDPSEARSAFLPNDIEGNAPRSWIARQRSAYRVSSQRAPHDHHKRDPDADADSDDKAEESLERKLARLRREVAEVKESFEQRRKNQKKPQIEVTPRKDEAREKLGHEALETPDTLGQVLDSIEQFEISSKGTSSSRLINNLNEAYKPELRNPTLAQKATSNINGEPVYPSSDDANQEQIHTLHKISEFDKRLRLLEDALGLDMITLPTQDRRSARPVLPVLDGLDRQVSSLSITEPSLDKYSRQIRQMIEDAEKLTEARKASAAQPKSKRSSNERSRISRADTNDLSEGREDTGQTSKINALHGTLATIESLSPILPSVLDRLRSLRTIHADAALANETLSKIESRQNVMAEELKEWTDGLEKVESAIQNGEVSMKGNMGA